MKRFLIVIFGAAGLVFLLFWVVTNSMKGPVGFLEFSLKNCIDECEDGSYMEKLSFQPNYEDRTLNVGYYWKSSGFAVGEVVDPTDDGVIGGIFFDRFEEIVKTYYDGGYKEISKENLCETDVVLTVSVSEISGGWHGDFSELGSFYWCKEHEDELMQELMAFYEDVVVLFTEEKY